MNAIKSLFTLTLLAFVGVVASAQGYFDDDIYFDASKAKKEKVETPTKPAPAKKSTDGNTGTKIVIANDGQAYTLDEYGNAYPLTVIDMPSADSYTFDGSSTRDVDEYNRRYISADTTIVNPDDYRDAFTNTRNIERFSNPDIVIGSGDEALIQYYMNTPQVNIYVGTETVLTPYYSWSTWTSPYWYNGWYSSWYSPYWAWGPSWSWSWYSPSWYYPSWSWGWGYYPPRPGWGPGWGPGWAWHPAPPRPTTPQAGRPHRPGQSYAGAPGSYRGNPGSRPSSGGYRGSTPAAPATGPAGNSSGYRGTPSMSGGGSSYRGNSPAAARPATGVPGGISTSRPAATSPAGGYRGTAPGNNRPTSTPSHTSSPGRSSFGGGSSHSSGGFSGGHSGGGGGRSSSSGGGRGGRR